VDVDDEAELEPFAVLHAPEVGGWAVMNAETLKVVEPAYLFRSRAKAVAWARAELERLRIEMTEYRRSQDAVVERGLARSWAARHADLPSPTP